MKTFAEQYASKAGSVDPALRVVAGDQGDFFTADPADGGNGPVRQHGRDRAAIIAEQVADGGDLVGGDVLRHCRVEAGQGCHVF